LIPFSQDIIHECRIRTGIFKAYEGNVNHFNLEIINQPLNLFVKPLSEGLKIK